MEKNNTVLIGVVNRKKDLDILLKKKWYRIPVKHAPVKKASHLALYQTSVFGRQGKRITYYAKIKSIKTVKRKTLLPEEKNHPRKNELYLKLILGPIQKLSRSILNRGRIRITFGFTVLSKLKSSHDVYQLFGIKPVELLMDRLLEKNGIKASREYCVMQNKQCRYRLDFALFCRKGKINIECDNEKSHSIPSQVKKDRKRDAYLKKRGWTVLRFTGSQVVHTPEECMRTVKKTVRKLGGIFQD